MGGETTTIEAERIGSMRIQTSAYGMVVPLVYGRTRITANLVHYGDFLAVASTTTSGGKGGGGVEQTTYTYYASVAMALGEGPFHSVTALWKGKEKQGDRLATQLDERRVVPASAPYTITIPFPLASTYFIYDVNPLRRLYQTYSSPGNGQFSVSGSTYTFSPDMAGKEVSIYYTMYVPGVLAAGFTQKLGAAGQTPWSYLQTTHPEQALVYPGVAYVAASNYKLTDSASLENHSFEVIGKLPYNPAGGIYDANPRDVLVDVLTNPTSGAGFPQDKLGDLTDFSNYCLAAGILVSPYWADQRPAHEYATELAQVGNAAPLWSEDKLKLIPYADQPVYGALGSFVPSIVAAYDLTDDDFLPTGDDPVRVRRKTQADAFNRVQIEFSNRTNDYNTDVAEASDLADIELHGLRPMSPLKIQSIVDAGVAETVASIVRDRALYIRNQYEFELGWRFALLEPMDIVTLTDVGLGLDKYPVRIREISESDDGKLSIVAEEYLSGVAAPAIYPSTAPEGYNADYNAAPGSVEPPVFFEPPIEKTLSGLEVWSAVTGAGALWGGCEVWVSLDGTTYKHSGQVDGGSRYGSLKSAMSAGAAATASVDLIGPAEQLLPGTAAEAASLATLCWVGDTWGGEFFAYQGAALVAENEYDLTGLVRAAYGTTDAAHSAGQQFVRVDERIGRSEPLDLDMVGKTIHFKFVSFNVWGGGRQTLDEVAAYPYTITGSMVKLPPSDVTGFTVTTAGDRIIHTWNAVPDQDLAEYEVREGQVWDGSPIVARARSTQVKFAPRIAGTYHWLVKAIDAFGNYSKQAAADSVTVSIPAAVAPVIELTGSDYVLSWNAPLSSFLVDHYELRHGATWGTGSIVTRANAQSHKAKVDWAGSRTFWVAAVDLAGNIGTPASTALTIAPPLAPAVTNSLSGGQVILAWGQPNASLPLAEYEVRYGASWADGAVITRLTAQSLPVSVDWGGSRTFWVAAVDINGTVGAAGSTSVTISPPSAPTVTAEVIDNNVLLRWSQSTGTLPVDHYELRRGATWATSSLIGALAGGFTVYFESSAGTYTYWAAAVDIAGNVGAPSGSTATVGQPPDFKLLYDAMMDLGSAMLSGARLEDGVIYAPISTTEAFGDHFSTRSWSTPQAQLDAGFDVFAEPAPTDGYAEWMIDYGVMVASTMITVTAAYTSRDGTPVMTPKISVSPDNVTWTDFNGVWQAFATAFRYVKVRLTASSTGGDDLLQIENVNVKLSFKRKGDAGSGTASASDVGGTQVWFAESFVDVEALDVTAGGTTPITAVYDFVDAPFPDGFKVYLFDSNGNRTSGPFSWSAKGV
jgi:hypothetical protein